MSRAKANGERGRGKTSAHASERGECGKQGGDALSSKKREIGAAAGAGKVEDDEDDEEEDDEEEEEEEELAAASTASTEAAAPTRPITRSSSVVRSLTPAATGAPSESYSPLYTSHLW